jgi:hypothetical protein
LLAYHYSYEDFGQIETWVVAPYKKPERDLHDNEIFNNHVSMLRIRSEHAIGFLKGRFQSLKRLRIKIKDEKSHKFATYWIAACVAAHSFAMQCEEEEKLEDGDAGDSFEDPFINDGLSSSSGSDEFGCIQEHASTRLNAARKFRERLKKRLFQAKEKRRQRRQF